MTDDTLYVREQDLRFDPFKCCGDEDLYPFCCPSCGHPMVFCYECDTLYNNLHDLNSTTPNVNHFDPTKPIFPCPKCGFQFEFRFMDNPAYRVTREDWSKANLDGLLKEPSVDR